MSEDITDGYNGVLLWPTGRPSQSVRKVTGDRRGVAEKALDRHIHKEVMSHKKPVWKVGQWIDGISVLNLELVREAIKTYDKAHNKKDSQEKGLQGPSGRGFRGVWERVYSLWRALRPSL